MGLRKQDQTKRMNLQANTHILLMKDIILSDQVYPSWLSSQVVHSLFPSLAPAQASGSKLGRGKRPLLVLSPLSSI